MSFPEATTTAPEPRHASATIPFDNTYARLPDRFFARLAPTPVAAPKLIRLNLDLSRQLGIDPEALASPDGIEILAGNRLEDGSEPLAMAYAGHQFGYFVPQLGDGRAILLGEAIGRDGQRYDIQLKGSGPTPFSRGGDGRAALGPVLREYIVSEAMAALGVPTTRALAAVTTGENVYRETILPGAVFTRVASSHLRVGTFQFFSARRDTDGLRALAEYAIARHYPEAAGTKQPYTAFLQGVTGRHAALMAQWLLLGFVHGVMNTDNTSISGETIDYGPCAFMEAYDPETVFSSIDRQGRYAFGHQPEIDLWNLTRLAETLLPLLAEEHGGEEGGLAAAKQVLETFAPRFEAAHLSGLRAKLGLTLARDSDATLIGELLGRLETNKVDFTLYFRRLCDAAESPDADSAVRTLFDDPGAYDSWAVLWRRRLAEEPLSPAERAGRMRAVNPAYIPRNHRIEEAIQAAVQRQDFVPFETLLEAVSRPYQERPGMERFAVPAQPEERVLQTFCGT